MSTREPPVWFHQGRSCIWPPYSQTKTAELPVPVARSCGSRLFTTDGRELVDGIASWWTAVHGYNHPHITSCISAQLEKMPHVMLGGVAHEQAFRLASRLAGLAPGDLNHVFFSDSGSVAVEVAMKMAVQYWCNRGNPERSRFISFYGGYHGDTFATMSVCDPDEGMHRIFSNAIQSQYVRPLPETEEEYTSLLDFASSRNDIAGVLIEPLLQGAGGMHVHDMDVLKRLRELCSKLDIFLLFDEIFTGFGRTGSVFASNKADVVPDILVAGKALTGGFLPLAATIASERIYKGFYSDCPDHALMHGPTFMGNAMCCAAANASLDLFEQEPRLDQVARIEKELRSALEPLRQLSPVRDVRVLGAMGAVELEKPLPPALLKKRFLELGVFIRPLARCIYLTPAYTIEREELHQLTDAITTVVEEQDRPG